MSDSGLGLWIHLRDRLAVADHPDYAYAGSPSDADLARFEAEAGFRLPASYRDFLRVFGPGEIGGVCFVRSPGCQVESMDLAKFNAGLDLERIYLRESARLRRMVLFGDSFGGDLFGWDPEDVTDSGAPEYGVYCMPEEEDEFRRVASGFWEFVSDFCLDRKALRALIPLPDSDPKPSMKFQPLILAHGDRTETRGHPA